MEDAWDRGADYTESLAADLAFHRALVTLSGNERLIPLYDQMLAQTQLLIRTAAADNPMLGHALRRSAHREIHDALAARDPDAAAGAIVEHYRYAELRLYRGTSDEEPASG